MLTGHELRMMPSSCGALPGEVGSAIQSVAARLAPLYAAIDSSLPPFMHAPGSACDKLTDRKLPSLPSAAAVDEVDEALHPHGEGVRWRG